MKKLIALNETVVKKVIATVSKGLTNGKGVQIPGKMCVEAAICYAYGLPHSDKPPCVGEAIRDFKIVLNDSDWSSNQARAKGMMSLAIAQLGSESLNQIEFTKRVMIKIINHIIADIAKIYLPEVEAEMRESTDLERLRHLCSRLRYAADAADAANADAAYAARNAAYAADAADAAYAARYAANASLDVDKTLIRAADLCLEVLIEMESPGIAFLHLIPLKKLEKRAINIGKLKHISN